MTTDQDEQGETPELISGAMVRYQVAGMDCADDACEIENAAMRIEGASDVKVSTATQVLSLRLDSSGVAASRLEHAVSSLGYQLHRMEKGREQPNHVSSQYRRALWTVVLLNVGFGIVEMVGGFISESQALKADALDFLGDGLITLFGVAAIAWSLVWRARAALAQGVFLGVLGLSVLANTAYRIFFQERPEAELMGLIAVVALLVNVAAALVLVPHRTGDANARAVWLFSRNDAIGNAAVIVAALLVAWTRTPWPDLAVAAIVASLFLHSAGSIIGDARADLREAAGQVSRP